MTEADRRQRFDGPAESVVKRDDVGIGPAAFEKENQHGTRNEKERGENEGDGKIIQGEKQRATNEF